MDKPRFVYVSYINSTPEKVWNALIDPEVTRQYWWNHRNASDWKVGSRWEHRDYDNADRVVIMAEQSPSLRTIQAVGLLARLMGSTGPGAPRELRHP